MTGGWVDAIRKVLGWLSAGVIPPVTPIDERTLYTVDERTRLTAANKRQRYTAANGRQRYTRAER
jgi:hypothetical protein